MVDSQSYETKASSSTTTAKSGGEPAPGSTSLRQEADNLSAGREEKEEMNAKALLQKSSV